MKCPKCESPDIITITYGTPPLSGARLAKAIEERTIVLGGCAVCEEDTPAYYCRGCEHRFDAPAPDNVDKTLYIPLYGKAYVSHRGILLDDEKAQAIWAVEGFPLKGKSRSKWLCLYMGMRAGVFDRWLQGKLAALPGALVLHLGCGMDSRCVRVGTQGHLWLDIDLPQVIAQRQRYFFESEDYRMVGGDLRSPDWLPQLPRDVPAIVVMEGVSMYLDPEALTGLLRGLNDHFPAVHILMDCYSSFAARASKYKNPINDVGVTEVYGIDDPAALTVDTGLGFVTEHDMTPAPMILQLNPMEQAVFRKLYAGKAARKLYRLYEFNSI